MSISGVLLCPLQRTSERVNEFFPLKSPPSFKCQFSFTIWHVTRRKRFFHLIQLPYKPHCQCHYILLSICKSTTMVVEFMLQDSCVGGQCDQHFNSNVVLPRSIPLKSFPFQIGHSTEWDQGSANVATTFWYGIWNNKPFHVHIYILPFLMQGTQWLVFVCRQEVIQHECNLKFTFNLWP